MQRRSANDLLAEWQKGSKRATQYREQTTYTPAHSRDTTAPHVDISTHGLASDNYIAGNEYGYDGCGYDGPASGELYEPEVYPETRHETQLMRFMNRAKPHEYTPFGVDTPAANSRLLSRRIFRSNEAGNTNGIPRYEARLYNRHLERDIDESLRPGEFGCVQRGYDMSDARHRIDSHAGRPQAYRPPKYYLNF